MFKFFIYPLLRSLIESQIKAAFNDKNKTRLKLWLAIAQGEPFNADSWKFRFGDGISLVDFGLNSSDEYLAKARMAPSWYERLFFGISYRRNYLSKAQTFYKNIFEIWIENKSVDQANDSGQVTFRWYHRFLNWCIRVSGLQ